MTRFERTLWVFDKTPRGARHLANGTFVNQLETSLAKENVYLKRILHYGFEDVRNSNPAEWDLIFLTGLELLPMLAEGENSMDRFSVIREVNSILRQNDLILRVHAYSIYEVVKNPYRSRK